MIVVNSKILLYDSKQPPNGLYLKNYRFIKIKLVTNKNSKYDARF